MQQDLYANEDIANILQGILKGVQYIHSINIMHRDIKMENIMLQENGFEVNNIKLVDFGFATIDDNSLEVIYPKCGTPGYAAPEIFNQQKEMKLCYDKRCDIFSVGIVFHTLIFGCGPFKSKEYKEVYSKNKECQIDFDEVKYKELNKDVLYLLKGMIAKNPDDRLSVDQILQNPYFTHKQIQPIQQYSMDNLNYNSAISVSKVSLCQEHFDIDENVEINKAHQYMFGNLKTINYDADIFSYSNKQILSVSGQNVAQKPKAIQIGQHMASYENGKSSVIYIGQIQNINNQKDSKNEQTIGNGSGVCHTERQKQKKQRRYSETLDQQR